MRSSKMSLNLIKMKIQFPIAMYATYLQLYFVETLSKLDLRFQIYSHFSAAQNSEIQRKLNTNICSIYKSILVSSDSFCLITSQMCSWLLENIDPYTIMIPSCNFQTSLEESKLYILLSSVDSNIYYYMLASQPSSIYL